MKTLLSFILSIVFCLPLSAQIKNTQQQTQNDTLVWFNNIPAGIQSAKQNKKYVVVYYEAEDCFTCRDNYKKVLEQLKDEYYKPEVEEFSNSFVLVIAQAKDTALLKEVGVKRFPGAAFFTSDQQILYYHYNIQLSEIITYMPRLDYKMQIHFFNTYQPNAIRKAAFDTAMVVKYLLTFLNEQIMIYDLYNGQKNYVKSIKEHNPSRDAGYVGLMAPPIEDTVKKDIRYELNNSSKTPITGFEKDKNIKTINEEDLPLSVMYDRDTTMLDIDMEGSLFNFKIDTAFIMEALDSYVVKKKKGNRFVVELITVILQSVDEHFCPLFLSKSLSGNDTIFNPTSSFSYLFDYLLKYKNASFYRSSYSTFATPLYVILSERLNNFIRYNQTENYTSIRNALFFQQKFAAALPERQHFEMPLLISNIFRYSDKINIDTFLNTVAFPYLDKLIAGKSIHAFMTSLAKTLGQKYRNEINYILWTQEGISYQDGNVSYYPTYLKEKFGSLLNDAAWYNFERKSDSLSFEKAMRYSAASLIFTPRNPYNLDTYAHLLYKKGDKKTAVLYLEKALREALDDTNDYQVDANQIELFKEELSKMKLGKL